MSYKNYVESPSSGSGPGAALKVRQKALPKNSQGTSNLYGGTNGCGSGAPLSDDGRMGIDYPVPVGHQLDLIFVMTMIDELSQVLKTNQSLTASVVDRMGKVREKSKHLNLNNDDLISTVATEINRESSNIEKENSELRRALEEAEYDKQENWKLAVHGANILSDVTEKLHRFKELHEIDTLTWHKNYRKQLAIEREENLNLRCHISDMKAAACRANQNLRDMRHFITEKNELHELRVQNNALLKEKRFWKRLALPLIADNDSEWSDDDDLIDPEEKIRLNTIEQEKKRREKSDVDFDELPHFD